MQILWKKCFLKNSDPEPGLESGSDLIRHTWSVSWIQFKNKILWQKLVYNVFDFCILVKHFCLLIHFWKFFGPYNSSTHNIHTKWHCQRVVQVQQVRAFLIQQICAQSELRCPHAISFAQNGHQPELVAHGWLLVHALHPEPFDIITLIGGKVSKWGIKEEMDTK